KATREKMPEEMVAQYPRVLQLIDSFNIANFEPPAYIEDANYSYEADDVIGTLAKQAEPQQIETYMVTGDKDFMQLLSPLIK
ncbi:hypothetical protein GWN91_04890, partial [Candidatus Saccharibacteria bacterium]|nr:hypothetical protein [Candidatus Saccharibacteria bacterium]NIW79549.1 hypothetical protein [Calditrichia bacterium]